MVVRSSAMLAISTWGKIKDKGTHSHLQSRKWTLQFKPLGRIHPLVKNFFLETHRT
jgi:hypothetical protein